MIHDIHAVLHLAYIVVICEWLVIAFIRFYENAIAQTIIQIIVGGGIIFFLGIFLGLY